MRLGQIKADGGLLASCGRPMGQAAVKILDDAGAELPAGETGEIEFADARRIDEAQASRACEFRIEIADVALRIERRSVEILAEAEI